MLHTTTDVKKKMFGIGQVNVTSLTDEQIMLILVRICVAPFLYGI